MQLLSILAPERAGTWCARCSPTPSESGCLPRWPYANGQSMTMVGDSADPIIASAAAFGAGAFDRARRWRRWSGGRANPATAPTANTYERQGLAEYLALGYVPFDADTNTRNANSIYGNPEAVWGSAATSLEYQVDDFAIAQFAARSPHDPPTYAPSCAAPPIGAASTTRPAG